MRAIYKDPKELATCLKDTVEQYEDDLITYEVLVERIKKYVEANRDRIFNKKGGMVSKVENMMGEGAATMINKIISEN